MGKRKIYYAKNEDGEWTQINELPTHNIEQLSFAFDTDAPSPTEDLANDDFTLNFTAEADDLEALYKLYDPDDIRDKIIDCVDAIHNSYLNGIYYAAHAESADDIMKIDKIAYNDMLERCRKLVGFLDLYVEACENEYLIERDPIMKSFLAKDLN